MAIQPKTTREHIISLYGYITGLKKDVKHMHEGIHDLGGKIDKIYWVLIGYCCGNCSISSACWKKLIRLKDGFNYAAYLRNFSLQELTKSDTAIRKGIDNEPNADQIDKLKALCENILQPVRDQFGRVKVTSGLSGQPRTCV